MGRATQISFHEATVVDFSQHGATIRIKLEGVLINKDKCSVNIQLQGVQKIIIDGETANAVSMEAKDGEVLSLEYKDGGMKIIIEWHNFDDRASFVRSYSFLVDDIDIQVEECQ